MVKEEKTEEAKSEVVESEEVDNASSSERQNSDHALSADTDRNSESVEEPKNQEAKKAKCFIRVKPEFNISRKRKRDEGQLPDNEATTTSIVPSTSHLSTTAEGIKNEDENPNRSSAKKKKNRCAVCRKKVQLTGFTCRCGGLYCAKHRYSDEHDCTFNYRELGAQEIRRNNPVVIGEKIRKI